MELLKVEKINKIWSRRTKDETCLDSKDINWKI